MELLFLHIGGVNISRLHVTTRMQMYRFLNLIYRIMGSNNASLFYNEQSNSGVWKKKQLHLFFFHPRPSLPIAFWYYNELNMLGNSKSLLLVLRRWGFRLLRTWGFLVTKMFLRALRQPGQGARHEGGALPAYWTFCTDAGGLVRVSSGAGFALLWHRQQWGSKFGCSLQFVLNLFGATEPRSQLVHLLGSRRT